MIEKRNPFKLRASEYIESDETFLSLFSPNVLDLLTKDKLLKISQQFQSAPGGGKTSLFRVFTPSSLTTLYNNRTKDDYKILYKKMVDFGVISDRGPHLLGIMLSCARNYALLEDLNLDEIKRVRLFYSLINARLIIGALRGALTSKNLNFPNDLKYIEIQHNEKVDLPPNYPVYGTGDDLFLWAQKIERSVCGAIDSFIPESIELIEGHDTLYALSLIKPGFIKIKGNSIDYQVLVMFDDVQKLSTNQRKWLLSTIYDMRPPIGVWLAERLEALPPKELFNHGTISGREYEDPINLEDIWRPNSKRFENFVTDIANRRSRSARDVEINSFTECLSDNLDDIEWQNEFDKAIDVISNRVKMKVGLNKKYEEWLKNNDLYFGTSYQQAIEWKLVEILIERESRRLQQTLDIELPLPELSLEQKKSQEVYAAAEFFLSQEFKIPYYFGMSRLATLSSSNIEQFLSLSGELFENYISGKIFKKQKILTPSMQENVLRKISENKWGELPKRIPNSKDVLSFIEAIHQCAYWETYKPNAPYAPGVTGIAISMEDRDILLDSNLIKNNPNLSRLLNVLINCTSYNLLEVSIDVKQGGKKWMLLYLNRWLCLHFKLPLHYGGWRSKNLNELCLWLDEGYKIPDKRSRKS